MNWEAIAAVAEGLGALGVIATVVYVALQIRHNAEAVQGSTEQALMTQEMNLYGLLAEHANVYRRGQESTDELDADEDVVFENLVAANMSQLYSAYGQYKRGLIPESVWTAYGSDWADFVDKRGFQDVWNRIQNSWPGEFRQALDRIAVKTE